MNWLDFWASIFSSFVSLGWPVALVVSVFLFRQRIADLLPLLRLKHKETELSFRLQLAEESAKQLPAPANSPEQTPEELDRYEQIARISPKAAILEMRASVDEAIDRYAAIFAPSPVKMSTLMKIRQLNKHNAINSETTALLDDVRAIGNAAAHDHNATVTTEDALRFRSLAEKAVAQLQGVLG